MTDSSYLVVFPSVFVLVIAAKSGVFRNVPDPLDVNDSLHRGTVGGNGDEVITLSNRRPCALTSPKSSTSTTTATLRLLPRRSLRRTKIDLA
jgi:hypothetical protein